jgi:ataxin-3
MSVYFEQQTAALCGRHAVNNLLQGPYVTEIDLARIASELDEKERALMLAAGADTADAVRYAAEGSGNVDDAGNFSVSVLSEALLRAAGVELDTGRSSVNSCISDPSLCEAFLLNQSDHWLSIRRINATWYNLNSNLSRPEIISTFYLTAYLGQLREDRYTVFVVRTPHGRLPAPLLGRSATDMAAANCWHDAATLAAGGGGGNGGGGGGSGFEARRAAAALARATAADDPAFEAALRASLAESGLEGATGLGLRRGASSAREDEDEQLRSAMRASIASSAPSARRRGAAAGGGAGAESGADAGAALQSWGRGQALRGGGGGPAPSFAETIVVDDEDLAAAIALSVGGETPCALAERLRAALPPEPAAADAAAPSARVLVRLPHGVAPFSAGLLKAPPAAAGAPLARRFLLTAPISQVYDFSRLVWLESWLPAPAPASSSSSTSSSSSSSSSVAPQVGFPRDFLLTTVASNGQQHAFVERGGGITVGAAGLAPSALLIIRPQ